MPNGMERNRSQRATTWIHEAALVAVAAAGLVKVADHELIPPLSKWTGKVEAWLRPAAIPHVVFALDENSKAVPSLLLRIENPEIGASTFTLTNSMGLATIPHFPEGNCRLVVFAGGAAPLTGAFTIAHGPSVISVQLRKVAIQPAADNPSRTPEVPKAVVARHRGRKPRHG